MTLNYLNLQLTLNKVLPIRTPNGSITYLNIEDFNTLPDFF